MISEQTKNRVVAITEAYIKTYPEEYEAVKKGVAMKKKMLYDDYASLEGQMEARALFEVSEKLQEALIMGMTPEQMAEFSTIPGSRWFAERFKEFALPNKI